MFRTYTARESDAFNEGFNACFCGQCDIDNPYLDSPDESELACHWLSGFEHCREVNGEFLDSLAEITSLLPSVAALQQTPVEEIASTIGVPLSDWPGNCYAIACQVAKHYLPDGRPVYGHYLGGISPDCDMFYGKPIVHHGWVAMPDGSLVDPTYWVFAAQKPSIRVVPPFEADDYDEGGNRFRRATLKPAPVWQAAETCVPWPDDATLCNFLKDVLGAVAHTESLSREQLFWLANLDLITLGEQVHAVYAFLSAHGLNGLIPVDNHRYAAAHA